MSTSWKEQTVGSQTSINRRKYRTLRKSVSVKPTLNKTSDEQTNHQSKPEVETSDLSAHPFPPNPETVYSSNNLLTINIDGKTITRTTGEWITLDPLNLAKVKNRYNFELEPHLNRVLFEKMRRIPNEEKKFLRLKLNISFPGYSDPVPASIPYKRYPVQFYNWWLKNTHQISLSFKEKLELLNRVNMLDKDVLIPKHRALMNR